jgi:poly-beta-1,6-N-acetyl-D-glucosamine synthase
VNQVTPIRSATLSAQSGPGAESDWHARFRFSVALLVALCWLAFSIWVSQPWLRDLGALFHPIAALLALTFVAYVPGFMNAFLLVSLVIRPRAPIVEVSDYPSISILIAAYQEEAVIGDTLASLLRVDYPGRLEVLVLDDGSRDATSARARVYSQAFLQSSRYRLRVLRLEVNRGKASALNIGLERASHDLIVTIDADTHLEPGSLTRIINRLIALGPDTAAVAGSVLVANPHDSLLAGAQEWDYFLGIAAVKRMQSMYHGTLVAQGAFSIYRRDVLLEAGGWPETVGEDIVLTWALLKQNWRIGYVEDAIAWTHAPPSLCELARQRKRWARGMIEALEHHKELLVRPRLSTMFIWWNLLFVSLDAAFTFVFLPGLALAFLGIYWLAGPITLLVLPLAALWNLIVYRIQTRMLKDTGVEMERSSIGFLLYILFYPLLMQPVSVWGYISEFTGRRKEWGGT